MRAAARLPFSTFRTASTAEAPPFREHPTAPTAGRVLQGARDERGIRSGPFVRWWDLSASPPPGVAANRKVLVRSAEDIHGMI